MMWYYRYNVWHQIVGGKDQPKEIQKGVWNNMESSWTIIRNDLAHVGDWQSSCSGFCDLQGIIELRKKGY
jgi:hypothetical protein